MRGNLRSNIYINIDNKEIKCGLRIDRQIFYFPPNLQESMIYKHDIQDTI